MDLIKFLSSKKVFGVLKVLVSAIALFLLISLMNPAKSFSAFTQFNLLFFPVLLIIILLGIFLLVLSYWLFLDRSIPLVKNFLEYLVVWSFGLFLPGKIGELGMIPVLKTKYKIPFTLAIPAVVTPKIFLFFAFFLILILFGNSLVSFSILYLALALVFVLVCLFLLKHKLNFLKKNKFYSFLFEKTNQYNAKFNNSSIMLGFVIAVFRVLLTMSFIFLCFLGFGVKADGIVVITALALSQLAAFIPITINGIGLREGIFVAVLVSVGFDYNIALNVAFIYLGLNYLVAIAIIIGWNALGFLNLRKSSKV